MTSPEIIVLSRPTGEKELALVEATGFRRWPPRLPDQPIFYPVTNEAYAIEIAAKWNTRDGGRGFVTRFQVDRSFMDPCHLTRGPARRHAPAGMRPARCVIHALAALALGAAQSGAAAEPWREEAPCGERLAAPVETPREGCVSSYCAAAGAERICSCLAQDGEHLGVVREREGTAPLRWEVALRSIPDPSAFAVERIQLGASSAPALLVAVRAAVGNGMGIEEWELRAIRGDALSEPLAVEDYGILGFATRAPDAPECRVLATRWQWVDGAAGDDALHLLGRWHRLEGAAWVPAPGRPQIARRYLARFERERLAAIDRGGRKPLLWFREATEMAPSAEPVR